MRTDLGAVTAYAAAVEAGYTGTPEEFAKQMADYGKGVQQVATDREAVEAAKKHVDQTVEQFDEHVSETEQAALTSIGNAAEEAKIAGVKAIDDAKVAGVKAVDDAKTSGVAAVEQAKNDGMSAVEQAVEEGKLNFVTDATLTESGRAADAKATGEAIAQVERRQNILIGTETGNPIIVSDAFEAPLCGLHVYGRSEQATTTGAQLLDLPDYTGVSRGVKITVKDGLVSLNGTCTDTGWILVEKITSTNLDGVYAISAYGVNRTVALTTANYSKIIDSNESKNVDDKIAEKLAFSATEGEVLNVDGIKVMLNAGETALPFEPYTGGKPSPSPDYPQEIQSARGSGSIGVEVHGKNIFGGRYYYANYANDILKIDGNKKEEVKLPYAPEYESFGVCKVIKCKKGKTYVISVTNPNKNATIGMAEYESIENAFRETNNVGFVRMSNKTKQLYTAKSDGILVCGIAGTWTDGKTTTHECTESELLQVEEASEATSYEPYHTTQTLTLSTPNGLPGIPVNSGGNYTDADGQQWICDEVDLERGVYVQRICTINGGETIWEDISDVSWVTNFDDSYILLSHLYESPLINNIIMSNKNIERSYIYDTNIAGCTAYDSTIRIRVFADSLEDAISKAKDSTFMCALATPIETPLPAETIAAYKALTTYGPTTVVETEDGAGLKLSYQRDVNIVVKQLQDALASITTKEA